MQPEGGASLPELPMDATAGAEEPPLRAPIHDLVVKLYDESREPLCRYLLSLGVSPGEADELCQEAFLRLFAALRRGKRIENPRAWVFTVAHNSGLDARTAGARREVLAEDADPQAVEQDPEEAVLADERMTHLHRAIQALPAHQRHCLNLRAEGFRYRQIAEILGVSVSVVAGSLRRTILRIREAIHE
jgi:RNA polymerase sigma-70 factor (ECF subfamily)